MLINLLKNRWSNITQWLSKRSLRRLLSYFPEHKAKIAISILCMVAAGASSSLLALLLGKLTDIGFYNRDTWIIAAAPIALIVIAIVHGACMFSSNYLLGQVTQAVLKRLRQELFHSFLRWPAEAYQRNSVGLISSKFVFEANVALSNATKSCITMVRDAIQVVLLSVTLFWNNWQLAIVSFLIVPLVVKLLRFISDKMKNIMSSCQESFASILVRVREVYQTERLVKLSNTQLLELNRFKHINEMLRQMMVRMVQVMSIGTPVTQLVCMSGVAVVLGFAMFQVNAGTLTIGDFVTFLAAFLLLMPPLKNLVGVSAGFIMMEVAAESIFATLDEKPETDSGTIELPVCQGHLVFDHVSLAYPNGAGEAVHDVCLEAKRGDCIAIVGLSGAGKSSLVNLIPRFWNPTAGRILLDGNDLQSIRLSELRKHISIVPQSPFLFDDSIANNIAYGSPKATPDEIRKAVELASLSRFVDSLPEGLDTPIGENGSLLSGGEKQRIAIARAFLKDAPILILDEATSALDSINEAEIKKALDQLMQGRTTFIVAHRLTTIEHATMVIAMSEGRIVECGSREELLQRKGLFAHLYSLQSLTSTSKEQQ